jgi:hypothetical protein
MEKDLPFPTLANPNKPSSSFCPLNLQTIQTLKAKSNPKQAHPKCKCESSSITKQKYFNKILQSADPANSPKYLIFLFITSFLVLPKCFKKNDCAHYKPKIQMPESNNYKHAFLLNFYT